MMEDELNYIKPLEWDSRFFGLKIGKVLLHSSIRLNEFHEEAKNYDCVYIFCHEKLSCQLQQLGAEYYGERVVFRMANASCYTKTRNVKIIQVKKLTNSIVELASRAGQYSRFFLDSKFSNQAKRMYKIWIKRDFANGGVLCSYVNDTILSGVMSYHIHDKTLIIGLLSVSERFQHRGIGRAFLEYTKHIANEQNLSIEVSTQGGNIPAKRLYSSCGFECIYSAEVWHLWNSEYENSIPKYNYGTEPLEDI